jgi:gas vesicle protein
MLDKQRFGTFVLGGVVGALAGILLTPKSGRELRGSIASRADEARERGRETYFEAQERMQERIAEAREGSPRRERTRPTRAVTDSLPKLGSDEPEASPDSPLLHDVAREVPRPTSGEGADPEEIRQQIQETSSRLRARLVSPKPKDTPEDRDG